MSWLPVSFDRETGHGCYLMRMQPGAVTIAHDHPGMEEFLVLEGGLVDSDGTVFGPGDFVSYEPGTHHNSWTEKGCLLGDGESHGYSFARVVAGKGGEAEGRGAVPLVRPRPEAEASCSQRRQGSPGGGLRPPGGRPPERMSRAASSAAPTRCSWLG
ncbi:MAG: hypothetical protein A2Y55_12845 [Actinobacteria bacterium RBG_16_68_12]|nr:MAG: hypothetical protein A2Y55_12845 [Actinobacteria bacterium RBG_16_68_12]